MKTETGRKLNFNTRYKFVSKVQCLQTIERQGIMMRNSVMTGTIILSAEDSARIRQTVLNPSDAYIQEWQAYFDKLVPDMDIHTEGSNTTVVFKDLDLSDLDAILEEEQTASNKELLKKNTEYVSTTSKVSFVAIPETLETMYLRFSFDVSSTKYDCSKVKEETVIQECNLLEAA